MNAISTLKKCRAFTLNKLRIGLDFDNTLACYDEVFSRQAKRLKYLPKDWSGDKQKVKYELLKMPEGELTWQRLQGQVYGPAMDSAVLFSGATSFAIRARQRGHRLFIVSHKTKYGHQDETKTPLRQKALQWMESKGFFDASVFGIHRQDVHFCDSREEKAKKIRDLEVDLFVDDLESVFEEKDFPPVRKILFKSSPSNSFGGIVCNSWSEVGEEVLGTFSDDDCKALLNGVLNDEVNTFRPIRSGANSKVFSFSNSLGKPFVIKLYPDLAEDKRPRLETEINSLRSLASTGMTPKLVAFNRERNLSVLEFLPGSKPLEITHAEVSQALSFAGMLRDLSSKTPDQFGLASEACLSVEEIERQTRVRLNKLRMVDHHELRTFLSDDFLPLLEDTMSWAKSLLGNEASWSKELSLEKRTLSPADFGFHNSIQDSEGNLKFIDFEYFGWDDPTKLIAEFMLHPGMSMSEERKDQWLKGCLSIFGTNDSDLPLRLRATTPLYALRWGLIVLNKFLDLGKRISTRKFSQSSKGEEKLAAQLHKAKRLCSQVKIEIMPSYA